MATNPYTQQSIAGYNANPPPDDGSQTESNRLEWAKHINKIGDPLKNLIEAVDDAVFAAFGNLLITNDPGTEELIIALDTFTNRKAFNELMFANIKRRLTSAEASITNFNVSEDTVVSQASLSRDMTLALIAQKLRKDIAAAKAFGLESEEAIVADVYWS